jgi:AcrR family transcriptional regulator
MSDAAPTSKVKRAPAKAAEAPADGNAAGKAPKRRRRPEEVRERILAAALTAFATYGFEGASVRGIAKDAHASLPLVLYHFNSKEELWKTMMEGVYAEIDSRRGDHPDVEGMSASERLRLLIADIVRFFANSPSLHRLMTLEGHQITDRLLWMCERHTRKSFRDTTALIAEAQKEGKVRMVDPARLRFAINAMSAVPFAVSAEYQILTNKSPFSSEEIEGTIALINQFVFISDD